VTAGVSVDGHDAKPSGSAPPMRLELAWCLPRQPATVVMARRLLDTALALMGVSEDCRADLALAVTEACANAVQHAHGASEYQVSVTASADRCVLEVTDTGVGIDHHHLHGTGVAGNGAGQSLTGRGRGLRLIRACTDTVETYPVHPRGLAIRMSKTLSGNAGGPAEA
jgi:serine/threonine-protein kinase RsbW